MLEIEDRYDNEFECVDNFDVDLVLSVCIIDDRGRENMFYPNKEQVKKIIAHLQSVLDKSEKTEK